MIVNTEIGALDLTGIVNAAPIGVLVSDSSGKIQYVNEVLGSMFGYTSEQLIGHPIEKLVPENIREKHVDFRKNFLNEHASRLISEGKTLRAVHSNGDVFHVEIGISVMGNEQDKYSIAFVIDVSERYRQSQRVYHMMESMPFGLLVSDEHGKIVMTNAELDRIFGYERSVLCGERVEVLIPERVREGHTKFREAFSKVPQNRTMGSGRELLALRRNGLEFPAEIALTPLIDDGKVRLLAVVTDVSKRKQMENTLRRQSLYDTLTSLPNRNLFFDRLEQACIKYNRHKTGFAVLMIDLDRFKEVNDSLGHPIGDIVLNEVGSRLEKVLRQSDSIARLGGDEFAAILHNIDDPKDAVGLAEKMVETLRPPVLADKHALSVGLSIGIAICPLHGKDQDSLIAHADYAMYQAKRGVRSVVFDNSSLGQLLAPHQAIATEIESALERNELFFFYQPKVNLSNGELIGVEALCRWRRPNIGLIPPDEFIPAIEESAILEKFTFATIEMAIIQLRDFATEGLSIPIAVNLSARLLEHEPLEQKLHELLKKYEVSPGLLTLEITETALVINPMKARRAIDGLVELGVNFSIDDFGAGYTSFKYLKTFRISEIKIDQEFVTGIEKDSFDACLVQSIAHFCRGLGVRLIVEGVETQSDLDILVELGCETGQGYHMARPMPIEDLKLWLVQQRDTSFSV